LEWQLILAFSLGGFVVVLLTGVPIAFGFLFVCMIMVMLLWGGPEGLSQLVLSIAARMARFVLLPIPLFILMGEVMFHSGLAPRIIDSVDMWLGRLPGRLGLVAVSSGTILAALTGASMSSTAILGSLLTPEMEARGYKKPMSLGPILGSGGLAIMIPPSSLAVFLGALALISIGKLLIAIIIPGLLMAVLYAAYIIIRCNLQPSIAPPYDKPIPPISHRLKAIVKYILPLGLVVFLVIGVILLGIATPSEAAATGALGTMLLAACYGKLPWEVVKKSVAGAIRITIMVFTILVGAYSFAQLLAFSGASRELGLFIAGLPVAPVFIVIGVLLFGIFLGMFMTPTGVLTVVIPLFMPVIIVLGMDPVWFGVLMLLNVEMATTSPPFGAGLYIMKGVAPPDTTMGAIYRAALPFLGCDLIAMGFIIAFPSITLWLPSVIR